MSTPSLNGIIAELEEVKINNGGDDVCKVHRKIMRKLCQYNSTSNTTVVYRCDICAEGVSRECRSAVRNNRWRKGGRELGMRRW